ncbi:MAG: hypothetical protein SOZ80_07565 [Prevotella sp.]|uniref:hypothetical protein n=1 Tax=Prevotella sp. TaxID=59823 RepID=UPI002A821107|nr:hypothetical protein [Prevotella sp.]MDY4020613.1 hypothetical protein [Prevotella sp.]
MAKKLGNALAEIIENVNGEYANGGYIVFSSENNELLILSEDDYVLASGIADAFQNLYPDKKDTNSEKFNKAPKPNQGWICAGSCSSTLGAISLAKKIGKRIGEGRDFEIHAEYKDGKYYVWYRVV